MSVGRPASGRIPGRMVVAALALLALAVPGLPAAQEGPAAALSVPAVGEEFDAPTQQRIKRLESELRCLVCQAQSIAESDSDFAADVRREVYRMVREGRSDADIKAFLVARYGDFILYRPPLQTTTALLWGGPAVLLLIGALTLFAVLRRRPRVAGEPISEDERRRAAALLAEPIDRKGSPRE